MKKMLFFATVAACSLAIPAWADEVGKVFNLGEVTTSAPVPDGTAIGGSTVTQDDVREFNRDTLDKAMLLVPGATVSNQGARNETNVWIRGFDRWRVPLYQDGIPIYLPVDDRIDFSRFTTADLSEIQVTKGYTSVINGPGAMGGSINLVSRQVTKPFEGDARMGASFDQDGAFNGFVTDAFGGSKIGNWYIQGSGTENYRNHFRLSDSYTPGGFENGGNRNESYSQDTKENIKVGYTPNATDEYAFNVINQIGHKDDPPADTTVPASSQKFWEWPAWDKQSAYFLSKTGIDDRGSYLKTTLYYDRFYNVLDAYDNANYNTQATKSGLYSVYDDRGAGGSVELSESLFGGQDVVRSSLHYRWDQHNEQDSSHPTTGNTVRAIWFTGPWEADEQNTYSAAVENTFHPTKAWDLVAGVSYDYRQMIGANAFSSNSTALPPYGTTIGYPLSDKHAVNPQVAAIYHYDETGAVHASLSDRTRFPTLFEMYSNKFGTATGNPYLQPEKTIYWETGVADTVKDVHVGVNAYYARILQAIESVGVTVPVNNVPTAVTQNQNVGTEIHKGFEVESSTQLLKTLEVGGNYSYLLRQVTDYVTMATMTPMHKLFLYADWKPVEALSVVPSVEVSSKRWLQSSSGTQFERSGDYALVNLKAAYDLTSYIQVEVGARNLTDQNYQTDFGYNAEGRSYFTNLRVTF
jgi:iron complex outermembrane receptor protein